MNLEYDHYDQLIFFRHDKLFPFFINLTHAMIYAVKGAAIFLHWKMLAEIMKVLPIISPISQVNN